MFIFSHNQEDINQLFSFVLSSKKIFNKELDYFKLQFMLLFDTISNYGDIQFLDNSLKTKLEEVKDEILSLYDENNYFSTFIHIIDNILDKLEGSNNELTEKEKDYLIYKLKCYDENACSSNSIYGVNLKYIYDLFIIKGKNNDISNLLLDNFGSKDVLKSYQIHSSRENPKNRLIRTFYCSFNDFISYYEYPNSSNKSNLDTFNYENHVHSLKNLNLVRCLRDYLNERMITFNEFIGNELFEIKNKHNIAVFHLNTLIKLLFKNKVLHMINKDELDSLVHEFKLNPTSKSQFENDFEIYDNVAESEAYFNKNIINFIKFETMLDLHILTESEKKFYLSFLDFTSHHHLTLDSLHLLMQSKLFVLSIEELSSCIEDNLDNKNLSDLIENSTLEMKKGINSEEQRIFIESNDFFNFLEFYNICVGFTKEFIPESLCIKKNTLLSEDNVVTKVFVNFSQLVNKLKNFREIKTELVEKESHKIEYFSLQILGVKRQQTLKTIDTFDYNADIRIQEIDDDPSSSIIENNQREIQKREYNKQITGSYDIVYEKISFELKSKSNKFKKSHTESKVIEKTNLEQKFQEQIIKIEEDPYEINNNSLKDEIGSVENRFINGEIDRINTENEFIDNENMNGVNMNNQDTIYDLSDLNGNEEDANIIRNIGTRNNFNANSNANNNNIVIINNIQEINSTNNNGYSNENEVSEIENNNINNNNIDNFSNNYNKEDRLYQNDETSNKKAFNSQITMSEFQNDEIRIYNSDLNRIEETDEENQFAAQKIIKSLSRHNSELNNDNNDFNDRLIVNSNTPELKKDIKQRNTLGEDMIENAIGCKFL